MGAERGCSTVLSVALASPSRSPSPLPFPPPPHSRLTPHANANLLLSATDPTVLSVAALVSLSLSLSPSPPPSPADDPHTKANLLLQAHLGRLALPISDYITDTKGVLDNSLRILQASRTEVVISRESY